MRLAKYVAVASLALVLCPSFVKSQTQKLDPSFVKAREARDKAIRDGDVATYDKYTTSQFEVVQPDGKRRLLAEQNQRLAAQRQRQANSGQPQAEPPAREDEKIDVYPGTIVLNWRATVQGKPANFEEVWIKENGTWKCASAHASLVPSER